MNIINCNIKSLLHQ